MHDNTNFDAILPQLAVTKVAWLNISTPSKRTDDLFSILMENGVIRKLVIQQACTTCIAAGDTENCKHLKDEIPWWHSEDNIEFLKGLYEHRRIQFQREMQSVVTKMRPNCFNEMKVKAAFTGPRVSLGGASRSHVYVAIDPAGGSSSSEGRGSDWAVVSIVRPECTIVGAEAIDVTGRGSSYAQVILNHLARLLMVPELACAIFVIIIENNFGGVAHALLQDLIVARFPGRCVFVQEKENVLGVRTTPTAKREMLTPLQMMFEQDNVYFADCFVTEHAKPAEMHKNWMEECLNYQEHVEAFKGPLQTAPKKTWTGKNSDGMRDDLCMALQLAVYWRGQYVRNGQRYALYMK